MTRRENEPSLSQPESPVKQLAGQLEKFIHKQLAISVQEYDLPGESLGMLVPIPDNAQKKGFIFLLKPNLSPLEKAYLYLHTTARAINGDLLTLPFIEMPVTTPLPPDSEFSHFKAVELTEKLVRGMKVQELIELYHSLSDRISPEHSSIAMLQIQDIGNILKRPSFREIKPSLLKRIKQEKA